MLKNISYLKFERFVSAKPEEVCRQFLAWGDFHARSRFSRSTIPEDKWGTTPSLINYMMLSAVLHQSATL